MSKAKSIPELCEGTITSSVMQSPGWTTWVKAQISAVLGTSFNAFTATITFDAALEPFSCLPLFNSRLIIPKTETVVLKNFQLTKVSAINNQPSKCIPLLIKLSQGQNWNKYVCPQSSYMKEDLIIIWLLGPLPPPWNEY